MKVLFVANPISGQGKGLRIVSRIKEALSEGRSSKSEFFLSKKQYDIRDYVKKHLHLYDRLVVIGGDGTLNEVLEMVVKEQVPLAIFPTGSGNGFVRALGLPRHIETFLPVVFGEQMVAVDCLSINGRYAVNVVGTGFDALVAQKFNERSTRGLFSYVMTLLKLIFTYQSSHYEVVANNQMYQGEMFLLGVSNSGQYGNNVYIAPHAQIDDGMAELVWIKAFPRKKILHQLWLFLGKKIDQSTYYDSIACQEVSIRVNEKPLLFHMDGETTTFDTDVNIKVHQHALKVLTEQKR